MLPRLITKSIHAYLDYPVAVGLIVMPAILNLGQSHPYAYWLSMFTGIAAFILTMLTDHHLGLFRVLSYKFHLAVDFMVGLVFLAAPYLFSFSGIDAIYYWVIAFTVLTVVLMHKPEVRFTNGDQLTKNNMINFKVD